MSEIANDVLAQLPEGEWEVVNQNSEPHFGIYVKVNDGVVQPMAGSIQGDIRHQLWLEDRKRALETPEGQAWQARNGKVTVK